MPGSEAVFVNPFKPENRNIGRRTGKDVKAGKNIRKFHDGIENFDDYWSDSDVSTVDSDDKWLQEKENERRIKGKAFVKNPNASKNENPSFKVDSPPKAISPFSPVSNSVIKTPVESVKKKNKASSDSKTTIKTKSAAERTSHFQTETLKEKDQEDGEPRTITRSKSSVTAVISPGARPAKPTEGIDQAGDVSGSITKNKSSSTVPNSPLQSFRTRKRLTYSGEQIEETNKPNNHRTEKRQSEEEEEEDEDLDATLTEFSTGTKADKKEIDPKSKIQSLSANKKSSVQSKRQKAQVVSSSKSKNHEDAKSSKTARQRSLDASLKSSGNVRENKESNRKFSEPQLLPGIVNTEEQSQEETSAIQQHVWVQQCPEQEHDETSGESDGGNSDAISSQTEACDNEVKSTKRLASGKKLGSRPERSPSLRTVSSKSSNNKNENDTRHGNSISLGAEGQHQTVSQSTSYKKSHSNHASLHTLFPHNDSVDGRTDGFTTLSMLSNRKSIIVEEKESDEEDFEIIDEMTSKYVTDLSTTMNSSVEKSEPRKKIQEKKYEKKKPHNGKSSSHKKAAPKSKSKTFESNQKPFSPNGKDNKEDEDKHVDNTNGNKKKQANQTKNRSRKKASNTRRSFENLYDISPVPNKTPPVNNETSGSGPGKKRGKHEIELDETKAQNRNTSVISIGGKNVDKENSNDSSMRKAGKKSDNNRRKSADKGGSTPSEEINREEAEEGEEDSQSSGAAEKSSKLPNRRRTFAHMTPEVSTIEEEDSNLEAPPPLSSLKSGKVIRVKRRASHFKAEVQNKKGKNTDPDVNSKGRRRSMDTAAEEGTDDEFSDYFSEVSSGNTSSKRKSESHLVAHEDNMEETAGSEENEDSLGSPPSVKKRKMIGKEKSTKKTVEKRQNRSSSVKGKKTEKEKRQSEPIPPDYDEDVEEEIDGGAVADDTPTTPPVAKKRRKSVTLNTVPAPPTPAGVGSSLKSILKKTPHGTGKSVEKTLSGSLYSAENSPNDGDISPLNSPEMTVRTPRFSTAPPQHFFEVTASETPQIPEKPKKNVKLIVPEPAPDGLRRSSRTRIPTLEWYKNERPKYERRKSGGFVVTGILPPPVDAEPKGKRKGKKSRFSRKGVPNTPRNMSMHVDFPSDAELAEDDDLVAVLNPDTQEEVYIDCIKSRDSFVFLGPTAQLAEPTDDLILCKSVQQKAFSVGELIIRPLREKTMQFVRNDTMVFRINVGKLAVTIHETTAILESGDVFFVPKGNTYSIKNLRDEEAKLVFFQHKG